jgi:predicted phosphodiesterase
VLVASDLHIPPEPTPVSSRAVGVLADRLSALEGPVVLVLAGDVVEMLAHPGTSPAAALRGHPAFGAAALEVAGRIGGRVVYLVGNHDGDLAWDTAAAAEIGDLLGADVALAADLLVATPAGVERVRVEHGHRLDPFNRFSDPRNPLDSPLGHHVVREVLPRLSPMTGFTQKGATAGGWLAGAVELSDPVDFPSFVGSRLVYRRLARRAWWLVVPVLLALLLREGLRFGIVDDVPRSMDGWLRRLAWLAGAAVVDLVLLAVVGIVLARRAWQSVSLLDLGERGVSQNAAGRREAGVLANRGYAGLVTGHTHHEQLLGHGRCFYANSGAMTAVVEAATGRFGLPPVYLRFLRLSWVELRADDRLRVVLTAGRDGLSGCTGLERLVAGHRRHGRPAAPHTVWDAGDAAQPSVPTDSTPSAS